MSEDLLKSIYLERQERIKKERQPLCARSNITCQTIVTNPASITVASVPDLVIGGDEFTDYGPENPPTVNGQTFTPAYGGGQRGVAGVDLLMQVFKFMHFNTPFYSSITGSYAQGLIPIVHSNESGLNIIPGVGVINNTGMNLHVLTVDVNNQQKRIVQSPIPNGYLGAVQFSDPVMMLGGNISVKMNFAVTQGDGVMFGYGQINYNGPSSLPVYGPPAP